MNSKEEFLTTLRQSLTGKVGTRIVNDNLAYYEDYINEEMRKGKSEQEVLDALGDPRLIARTIVTANGGNAGGNASTVYEAEEAYERAQSRRDQGENVYGERRHKSLLEDERLKLILIIIGVIVIIALIVGIILDVLSFLAPVLIPIILVLILVKVFRDWMN